MRKSGLWASILTEHEKGGSRNVAWNTDCRRVKAWTASQSSGIRTTEKTLGYVVNCTPQCWRVMIAFSDKDNTLISHSWLCRTLCKTPPGALLYNTLFFPSDTPHYRLILGVALNQVSHEKEKPGSPHMHVMLGEKLLLRFLWENHILLNM